MEELPQEGLGAQLRNCAAANSTFTAYGEAVVRAAVPLADVAKPLADPLPDDWVSAMDTPIFDAVHRRLVHQRAVASGRVIDLATRRDRDEGAC